MRTRRSGTATSSTPPSATAGSTTSRTRLARRASPSISTGDAGRASSCARATASRSRGAPRRCLAASERCGARRLRRRLARAAASYLRRSRRRARRIIAGFPWFTDWGRDTFIAMRGLRSGDGRAGRCGSDPAGLGRRGQRGHAAQPLSRWRRRARIQLRRRLALVHRRGARFLEPARQPDAPSPQPSRTRCAPPARRSSTATPPARGSASVSTRDGLLRAGVPGVQLTWMDAKIGDRVVTPRIGKPVEVQALWINALRIAGARWSDRAGPRSQTARADVLRRAVCRPGAAACSTWWMSTMSAGAADAQRAAQPDPRRRRPAVSRARGRQRRAPWSISSRRAADPARPADARRRRSRLCRPHTAAARRRATAPTTRAPPGRG